MQNLLKITRFNAKLLNLSNVRMMSSHKNRLSLEKSPYLLQHAANPVDWHAWNDEAFAKARAEDKPIFLSVGYSTCHWCHVMEHESFESEEIAAIMNEHFINVKVDREERPDVDRVYMTFVQATSGRGGWPMSMFLTPTLHPITGGTYFPPHDSHGQMGFDSVLKLIHESWRDKRTAVIGQGESMLTALKSAAKPPKPTTTPLDTAAVIAACTAHYKLTYDARWGGFGQAPKFPQPSNVDYLLAVETVDGGVGSMITHTLQRMQQGGIYDHLAGGFHRYSTDGRWHVPHFEKMLYDNAQLTVTYSNAFSVTGEKSFLETTKDILRYVHECLTHPSGGFYAAEDADSLPTATSTKKVEGAFCVWSNDEIVEHLSGLPVDDSSKVTVADVFNHYFNMKTGGNVNPNADPHGELTGKNVPIAYESLSVTADELGIGEESASKAIATAKSILADVRARRPLPHLDTKIVTSWNSLMIKGLMTAACVADEGAYAARAIRCMRFMEENLMTQFEDGSVKLLRAVYGVERGDEQIAQIAKPYAGYADDYSTTIAAYLSIYNGTLDSKWLRKAVDLQSSFDAHFWSTEHSAYYSTDGTDDTVLIRMVDDQDGAEPASNSIAVDNLMQLSMLTGDEKYGEKATAICQAFASRLTSHPYSLPAMVKCLVGEERIIVIHGDATTTDYALLVTAYHSVFSPRSVIVGMTTTPLTPSGDNVLNVGEVKLANVLRVDDEHFPSSLKEKVEAAVGGEKKAVALVFDKEMKLLHTAHEAQELKDALKSENARECFSFGSEDIREIVLYINL